ncbi:MAG: hypothetical protein ABI894_14885 [Ilumatobacteraceae bacterium]
MIDLERSLGELADRLEIPGDEWLVTDVLRRLAEPSPGTTRPLLPRLAGAIAAATVAAVLILPGPRHAVGRWLGFDSVRIQPSGSVPSESTSTGSSPTIATSAAPDVDLGPAMSIDQAMSQTALPDPTPALLGAAQSIHVVTPPSSGQIILVYSPSGLLPQSDVTDVGALVSVFPAHINAGYFQKSLGNGTTVRPVDLGEVNGYWIEGSPHELMFDTGDGEVRQETLRLATNTLLWERDGVVYRIEADISLDAAVRIANTVP